MKDAASLRARIVAVVESSTLPVAYADQAGTIRTASIGYKDAFGSDVAGRTIADLTHPDDAFAVELQTSLLGTAPKMQGAAFVKRYLHTVTRQPVQALVLVRVREAVPGTVEVAWPTAWTLDGQRHQLDVLRASTADTLLSRTDLHLFDLMAELYPSAPGARSTMIEMAVMAGLAFRA